MVLRTHFQTKLKRIRAPVPKAAPIQSIFRRGSAGGSVGVTIHTGTNTITFRMVLNRFGQTKCPKKRSTTDQRAITYMNQKNQFQVAPLKKVPRNKAPK